MRKARSFVFEDKDIDRAFAFLFLSIALISAYGAMTNMDQVRRLQLLATVPINLMACGAFLVRRAPLSPTGFDEVLVPFVSFMMPNFVINSTLLPLPSLSLDWGIWIALPGILLSVVAILYLRLCFAILPAVRGVVDSGPYRIVRHPLYLGESVYILGIMLLAFNPLSLLLYAINLVLIMIRIGMEERKLLSHPDYLAYSKKVRYRMIPFIY